MDEKTVYVLVEFAVTVKDADEDEMVEEAEYIIERALSAWNMPDHYITEVTVD